MTNENIIKLIDNIKEKNNPIINDRLEKLRAKFMPQYKKITEEILIPEKITEEVLIPEKIDNKDRVVLHITYSKEGKCWKIVLEGESEAIFLKRTKEMAVDEAKNIAKNFKKSQIIIHKKDGLIQEERTYASDPKITKG